MLEKGSKYNDLMGGPAAENFKLKLVHAMNILYAGVLSQIMVLMTHQTKKEMLLLI